MSLDAAPHTVSAAPHDMPGDRIAVIGAGMAGTMCAARLRSCGLNITVFDKGRGPGGRMATRRIADATFDHGAQYFVARSAAFRLHVSRWRLDHVVAPWRPRIWRFGPKLQGQFVQEPLWYVGTPSMSALLRHDQQGLDIRFNSRIIGLHRADARWRLTDENGQSYPGFSHVVLAVPAPQAAMLLHQAAPELARQLSEVRFDPCWAGLFTFSHPVDVPFDAATVDHGLIAWVARNSSKPHRDGAETWVVHACTEWSQNHLEDDASLVAREMTAAFANLIDERDVPQCTVHRWRYARASNPLGKHFLLDPILGIGVCGDWCIAGRIEAAYLSGNALAEVLLTASAESACTLGGVDHEPV